MEIDSDNKKKSILFLFKENRVEDIPARILNDENLLVIHETPKINGDFSEEKALNFEQVAGLDGMMKSVWNQIDWLKRWGTLKYKDGNSFADRYKYKGLSLWFFAELYMHYPKILLRIITAIDIFHALQKDRTIEKIYLINHKLVPVSVIIKAATIAGIPVEVIPCKKAKAIKAETKELFRASTPIISAILYNIKLFTTTLFIGITKPLCRKKISPYIYNGNFNPSLDKKRIVMVSHGSYWRKAPAGYPGKSNELDMYWDRLLDELRDEAFEKNSSIALVGAGPRSIHRRRNAWTKFREFFLPFGENLPYAPLKCFLDIDTWYRIWKGSRNILRQRKEFLKNKELEDSIVYHGVNFFDEYYSELKRMFILMLPWGVKIIEQAYTAFDKLNPDVICLYAEAGGYGRALSYAAKLHGIKTIAIQHGLIFPHNYTYVHTKEEIDGEYGEPYPYTDRFLLYDRFVKNLLIQYGNYPAKTLQITGGHKMDNLLHMKKHSDSSSTKKKLGFDERDKFAVIASRFSEIGTAFESIVEAIEQIPRMHLIVKPHQAELPQYYTDIADKMGAKKVIVVSNKENLFELLLASDLLITVNSLAALEALIIGKPVMVVNLPNHLSVYVDSGIAIGIETYDKILPELQKILSEYHDDILTRQKKFSQENAFMTDGLSGERIKAEIYAQAFSNLAKDRSSEITLDK
ncbi:MAG: CDP-glycerol glycerophosphotransferase family protein [Acidobacteria bacterium]|nr:CDP-glycerol glycerophosphotransferase family protein [Acidobacteriota bacterium]